eukprot:scaffold3440_cov120-Skeletonema_marinoi.AAC.1
MMIINPAAVTCLYALLSVLASGSAANIRGAAIDDHSELRHLNSLCNCISTIDSSCHPNSECENSNRCTKPNGQNNCNASGNYIWQEAQSTPLPTPAPTSPPTVTTPSPTPFPTGPQTCPEQYCPASSPSRKLEATLPRRRDVVECDLTMITLATYTAPGTSD